MFQIIPLTPLLLLTKTFSASKIIGDIFMPAFLTKDNEVQLIISRTLPVIACMSLGPYKVVFNTLEAHVGHRVFENSAVNMSVVCPRCHSTENNEKSPEHVSKLNRNNKELFSESNSTILTNSTTATGLKKLFVKFLNQKMYTNIDEDEYWRLVGRLCIHYYVFDYGVSTDIITMRNCKHILRAVKPFIDNTVVSS